METTSSPLLYGENMVFVYRHFKLIMTRQKLEKNSRIVGALALLAAAGLGAWHVGKRRQSVGFGVAV